MLDDGLGGNQHQWLRRAPPPTALEGADADCSVARNSDGRHRVGAAGEVVPPSDRDHKSGPAYGTANCLLVRVDVVVRSVTAGH